MPIDPSDNTHQPLRLVQITDSHLGSRQGEPLLGMDTDQSLAEVVQLVSAERGESDLLLATGDLSNNGSEAAYQRFHALTEPLARQALWLPGNHDDWSLMQRAMAGGGELLRSLVLAEWQIIMLDSTIAGQPGGALSTEELSFLQHTLQQSTASHVLLCLHHHPVNIGCQWLDQQQVSNSKALFDIVDSFDSVRGLLWGHIHQQHDQMRQGVRLMATPSTCIQFEAHSDRFKLARLNPGYRWLELYPDGRIETAVSRLQSTQCTIDYDSSGY